MNQKIDYVLCWTTAHVPPKVCYMQIFEDGTWDCTYDVNCAARFETPAKAWKEFLSRHSNPGIFDSARAAGTYRVEGIRQPELPLEVSRG